jgi:hypothetical protein
VDERQLEANDRHFRPTRRGRLHALLRAGGAEQEVAPGDVLMLTFSADNPHGFEISRVRDGIMLCRLGDSEVAIEDKRGRSLRW